MKTSDKIFLELVAIEGEFSQLNDDSISYLDVCQKLHDNGQLYLKAANNLTAITSRKTNDGISNAVTKVRFLLREQGLLMLDASRRLSGMAAKSLALSEKMAAITSGEVTC